jgi:chromosome segregation ATPase
LEEDKSHIIKDLNSSLERERKLNANVRKLQSNLETVESEKLFMNESIKQLKEEVDDKKKDVEKIKEELEETGRQVLHCKLENNMTMKHLKEARADYQRSHEKEMDIKVRLVQNQSQLEDTNQKLACKIAECLELLKRVKQLEKKYREVKRDLERTQDTLKMCRSEVKSLNHENAILKADKTLRERDIIANQMYRKSDENSLLENQVSGLKMTIDRGNSMYNERLEDIRILKLEILDLRSQSNMLKRALENTVDMRHEVLQLHRKLNQEKTRAKALEQEMLTPMNVHRWRKLNRRDPGRMELIKKCQRLQKNALNQFAKATKGEEVIAEQQEKIIELTKELEKRQNFDVHEKLLLTRVMYFKNSLHK